ncbi:MAG: topoisomerase DNA-binding C4 zinc finger domain-containing protein [Burkholderiales bacterium]|nr:topoisomerase DNA-binding C4 zinc finger domain-containing protein [Burkholderiales bacterium]
MIEAVENTGVAPAPNPKSIPTPACPVCSGAMVKRTAKRGSNAGQTFWGCASYPRCKGTRPIG